MGIKISGIEEFYQMRDQELKEKDAIKKLFKQLLEAQVAKFPKHRKPLDAPMERGVYIIYSPESIVLHVGSTPYAKKGVHQRLAQHLATKSSFSMQYLKGDGSKLRGGYKFRSLVVSNARQRALLEAYAIGNLCPTHIGVGID